MFVRNVCCSFFDEGKELFEIVSSFEGKFINRKKDVVFLVRLFLTAACFDQDYPGYLVLCL